MFHSLAKPSAWLAILASTFTLTKAVTVPGCQSITAQQQTLTNVTTAFVPVGEYPYDIIFSHKRFPNIAFVGQSFSIGVLDTATFPPKLIQTVDLPPQYARPQAGALVTGLALTQDERYLLATTFSNVLLVLDTLAVIQGQNATTTAIVGAIYEDIPNLHSAIRATAFHSYAFVSHEDGNPDGSVAVYHLDYPHPLPPSHNNNSTNTSSSTSVTGNLTGYIPLGISVVGQALTRNQKHLFVTEEVNYQNLSALGALYVLDTPTLLTNPNSSITANVSAGCEPVRVIFSRDEKVTWVSARESNSLLAFDTAKVLKNSSDALLASVLVGNNPTGIVLVRNGTRLLAANSDRTDEAGGGTGISVVDVQAALRGENATLGAIPSGDFPRDITLSPDGRTVLVTVYGSNEVQAIEVASLP